MGSKTRIAKLILPLILKGRKPEQYYVEPFCGGCNSLDKVSNPRIGSDCNRYLIAMWIKLLKGWIPPDVSRDQYYSMKENPESHPDYLVGWTGFVCSFRGRYFEGFAPYTDFKRKNGKTENYQRDAARSVLLQLPKLENVKLENKQYYNLEIPKNSIVYCDPPYAGTKKYMSNIDPAHFWEWVRKQSLNHSVFVSEYSAPRDFACIWKGKVAKQIGNKVGDTSSHCVERLFRLRRFRSTNKTTRRARRPVNG